MAIACATLPTCYDERLKTGGSSYDPLFERPDLVKDDYYRFGTEPCGW